MWIHPKPAFSTTSTATALVPRATSASDSSPSHPCPPTYPLCNPQVGPGPALVPIANADSSRNSAHSSGASSTGTGTLTPTPQAALASSIQHFGKRNFVGLLVLGLLALAGLVLWCTFGAWPQRMMRRIRARVANKGDAAKAGRDGDSEGRRGADLDRDQSQDAAHEPHESEEDKVQPASEEGAPSSPQSLELEMEGLGKGTVEEEAKKRTLPRVRFA
ncbi:hypothetical protein C8T65DRAFT_734104 [Cerioporus squamosus]|nr:hypothetical protein C8T65DRAFT_734104 [Cerioporus squamosus]